MTGVEPDGEGGIWRFSRPVLVATVAYPPMGGGSSTIMKNLLDPIDPGSVVLAVQRLAPETERLEPATAHRRHFVERLTCLPGRIEKIRRRLWLPVVERRLVALGRKMQCGAVVGVFPDVFFLDAACRAAHRLGVPFLPYLHDTVKESLAGTRLARYGAEVHGRVLSSSKGVLVATRGMEALFRRKYGKEATTVPHVFPEVIPERPDEDGVPRGLFWSGYIYSINVAALRRVFDAAKTVPGVFMTVASQQSKEYLVRLGFSRERLKRTYVPVRDRTRYLQALRDHGVLVLALSWPDESPVHEDELRTIFPTKTPEYLASGRPILVHCPEHYYVAQFFMENQCGEVVTERSGDEIERRLRLLFEDGERRHRLSEAALRAAHEFRLEKVLPVFHGAVQGVLGRD